MDKSIEILEEISSKCLGHKTRYNYGKHLDESDKYKRGRVNDSSWINELIYFFVQKERNFITEFKEHLNQQKKEEQTFKDGDYKRGLLDEIQIIEELLYDKININ